MCQRHEIGTWPGAWALPEGLSVRRAWSPARFCSAVHPTPQPFIGDRRESASPATSRKAEHDGPRLMAG